MNLERTITLSKKLYKSFRNYQTPTDLFTHLKSNSFVKNIFQNSNLDGEDFIYLVFLIYNINQGKSPEEICEKIKHNMIAVKIAYIEEEDPKTECESCGGAGSISCNYCDGDGRLDCNSCDGSGNELCDYCDGDGEDEEGEPCSECQGSGNIECDECDGDGAIECNHCYGDGESACDDCYGEGEIEQDGMNLVTLYYIVCTSPNLKSFFETKETYDQISTEFLDNLLQNKDVLICKSGEDITDDYYGDFNPDEACIDAVTESPKFVLQDLNQIHIFF